MFLALVFCCTIVSCIVAFTVSKSFAKSPLPSLAITVVWVALVVDVNLGLLGFVADVTNQTSGHLIGGLILTTLASIAASCAGRYQTD